MLDSHKGYMFIRSFLAKHFPKGSLRQRMLGGTLTMLSGTLVAQFSTFVTLVVSARLLGSVEYGKYGVVQSTLGLLALLAGLGMGLTNRRYVGELRDSDKVRCGRVIGFSTLVTWFTSAVVAAVLFVWAPFLSSRVLNAPELALVLRLATAIILFNGLNESQVGVLSGLEDFRSITNVNFLRAVAAPFLLIGGVVLWRLPGLVAGMALTALVAWLVSIALVRSSVRKAGIEVTYKGISQERQIVWRFAIPVVASGTIFTSIFFAARAIITQYPGGYEQLGIFTAAEQWLVILALVPGQIVNVSQPILSNVYATQDRIRFGRAIAANMGLSVGVAVFFAVIIILIAKPISALYGATFVGLSSVIVLVCLTGILRVFSSSVGTMLVTINRMWVGLWINLLWGAVFLSVVATLMIRGLPGAYALGYANIISYTLQATLVLTIFYRFTKGFWRSPIQQPIQIDV